MPGFLPFFIAFCYDGRMAKAKKDKENKKKEEPKAKEGEKSKRDTEREKVMEQLRALGYI